MSYINNLHPQHHQELYQIINQVISKTIPLWDMSLSGMGRFNSMERIKYELSFDPDPEDMSEEDGPQQEDGEEEDDYWDRRQEWENDIRKAVPCDPGEFSVPEDTKEAWRKEEIVDLVKDYAEHGLQIIVKLATIELTPQKPTYAGGSWHVEGQLVCHSPPQKEESTDLLERAHLCHCSLLLRQRKYQRKSSCIPPTHV